MIRPVFKVCLIGEDNTDKEIFLKRFTSGGFNYSNTLGSEIYDVDVYVNNLAVKMQIWGLTTNERFRTVLEQYEMGARCFMYLFDLSRVGTLDFLENKIKNGDNAVKKEIYTVLVGNRNENTQINRSYIDSFISRHKISDYFEINIRDVKALEVFKKISEKLLTFEKKTYLVDNL